MDLNALRYVPPPRPLQRVYFQDIPQHLVEHIRACTRVYGCVAWFSHREVLATLKERACCIIMNREDWSEVGRHMENYNDLKPIPTEQLCAMSPMLRTLQEGYVNKAVRSVGTPERGQNRPRLHHKFLLLERSNGIGVWTGSFNITMNASLSLENAIYSEDPDLVQAYIREFVQVLCLSSELNDQWVPEMYFTMRALSETRAAEVPISPIVLPSTPVIEAAPPPTSWTGILGRWTGDFVRSFNEATGKPANVAPPPIAKAAPPPIVSPIPPSPKHYYCTTCLRNTHTAERCYAKTDLRGNPIQKP